MPAPYIWTEYEGALYLRFNYRGVASVRPGQDGKWPHVIRWQGRELHGVAGSRDQAVRWIERFIAARSGLPVIPQRRSGR